MEKEIIQHLRTFEIAQAKGQLIEEFSRKIGVHPVTLAKWRKKYNGMNISDAKKLKDLEKENARLKKLLAEADLFLERGTPKHIRSDNGPEFIAKKLLSWFKTLDVSPLFIEPGSHKHTAKPVEVSRYLAPNPKS